MFLRFKIYIAKIERHQGGVNGQKLESGGQWNHLLLFFGAEILGIFGGHGSRFSLQFPI